MDMRELAKVSDTLKRLESRIFQLETKVSDLTDEFNKEKEVEGEEEESTKNTPSLASLTAKPTPPKTTKK